MTKSLYHPTTSDQIVKSLRPRRRPSTPLFSVVKFEVVRQLKKPSFWIALLMMPAFIVGIVAFSAATGYTSSTDFSADYSGQVIGIVDEAGILPASAENSTVRPGDSTNSAQPADPPADSAAPAQLSSPPENSAGYSYRLYSDLSSALAALRSGDLGLVYHLPAGFLASPESESASNSAATPSGDLTTESASNSASAPVPSSSPTIQSAANSGNSAQASPTVYRLASYSTLFDPGDQPLRAILRALSSDRTPAADVAILTNNYVVNSTTIDESGSPVNLLGQAIIPVAILVIFYIMICVFGNRFLMTVVEEKENRISEMILTAVSARHLIIGKLLALIILSFIQIAVLVLPALALLFAARDLPVVADLFAVIQWDPLAICANLALLFAALFLFAGTSTLVGALVPTAREASQYIGPILIGMMLPLFFVSSFLAPEPSATVYFLTYFPLSAPMALMIRSALGSLAWWEFAIGLVELILLAALVIHLTVKTFSKNAINFSVRRPTFGIRKKWKNS